MNFRNFKRLDLEMNPKMNIFYGNNGQGKTNLLEALYLSGTGRSHRSHNDKEMIQFSEDFAHIQTFVTGVHGTDRIDLHLKNYDKKGIAINGLPIKKLGELFGVLLVVIFSPEDLLLVKAGPSERRRFLDMEICQLDKVYYYDLQQYHKILKQRNNLLKSIQRNKELKETLFAWDTQLDYYGQKIMENRKKFTHELNDIAGKIHRDISGQKEQLSIIYKPNVPPPYFLEKLKKHRDRDIMMGTTGVGPHKDDMQFFINEMDVRIFGSQGQQRTVSLCSKLAEIQLIQKEKGESPLLLLDDVFSELDKKRQGYLLERVSDIQTIITCTGVEDVLKNISQQNTVFYVKQGQIQLQHPHQYQ